MLLETVNISKTFDNKLALNRVSFGLEQGRILALLGASGCGKTTLLRIIAGLEKADSGKTIFDGRPIDKVSPHLRNFGMMFQEFALFPHKNVSQNIAFGLKIQNLPAAQIQSRTKEMLHIVGLAGFENRHIASLSGGERQRVALARSLAPQPRLLMLDEPMGALDRSLRERLMVDLRKILKQVEVTAIVVTHDQSEAFAVADEVAILHAGCLIQVGSPETVYIRPATTVVARFLGFHNLLRGRIVDDQKINTEIGTLSIPFDENSKTKDITVLLRPGGAILGPVDKRLHGDFFKIDGIVRNRLFQGSIFNMEIEINSQQSLKFDLPVTPVPPHEGEPITLFLNPHSITILPYEEQY